MTLFAFLILITLVLVLSANAILNAQSPAGERARAFVDAVITRIRGQNPPKLEEQIPFLSPAKPPESRVPFRRGSN